MKTLYTLLLAFGLCFTVHAQQSTYNFENYFNNGNLEINALTSKIYDLDTEVINYTLNEDSSIIDIENQKVLIVYCKDFNFTNISYLNEQFLEEVIFVIYKTNSFVNNYLTYNFNNVNVKVVLREIPD